MAVVLGGFGLLWYWFFFRSIALPLKQVLFQMGLPVDEPETIVTGGGLLFMLAMPLFMGYFGIFIIKGFAYAIRGHVSIAPGETTLYIRDGVGRWAKPRDVQRDDITHLDIVVRKDSDGDDTSPTIQIQHAGGKPINVGSALSEPQRRWLFGIVQAWHTGERPSSTPPRE